MCTPPVEGAHKKGGGLLSNPTADDTAVEHALGVPPLLSSCERTARHSYCRKPTTYVRVSSHVSSRMLLLLARIGCTQAMLFRSRNVGNLLVTPGGTKYRGEGYIFLDKIISPRGTKEITFMLPGRKMMGGGELNTREELCHLRCLPSLFFLSSPTPAAGQGPGGMAEQRRPLDGFR